MQGDKTFGGSKAHAVEQAPKGTNPFARAGKRQAQVCIVTCFMCGLLQGLYVCLAARYA